MSCPDTAVCRGYHTSSAGIARKSHPGGASLALGLLLRQRGIPPTIYELRSKLTPQELAKPSGMLDLHDESGLRVMRECGLWDSFQAAVGDCSEACRVLNPQSTVLHTDEGELASRPEITRNALTKLLIENLPSDFVKWNHKTTGPFYGGAQLVTVTVRNSHLVELNGSGTLYALGGGNGIMTHRGPQDSIRHWAKAAALEGKSAAEVKMTLLSDDNLFSKWARWEHCTDATLVGDAAHLMTPWGGEGVNMALWDSLDLEHALGGVLEAEDAAAWQAALEPRFSEYEEAMLLRAKEKAEERAKNKDMFLSENGGQAMADMFKMFEDMEGGNWGFVNQRPD
ncbi:salicylate hydroxylase [Lipomyces tetrasporus]